VYFFKYTPIALTSRGAACLAEDAYGKLLQKGYSATIHLPPCGYNKITNKHKKKMEFEETMKFETKLQSTN